MQSKKENKFSLLHKAPEFPAAFFNSTFVSPLPLSGLPYYIQSFFLHSFPLICRLIPKNTRLEHRNTSPKSLTYRLWDCCGQFSNQITQTGQFQSPLQPDTLFCYFLLKAQKIFCTNLHHLSIIFFLAITTEM